MLNITPFLLARRTNMLNDQIIGTFACIETESECWFIVMENGACMPMRRVNTALAKGGDPDPPQLWSKDIPGKTGIEDTATDQTKKGKKEESRDVGIMKR